MPQKRAVGECRHCQRWGGIFARELCYRCYRAPDVRAQYPAVGNRTHDPGYELRQVRVRLYARRLPERQRQGLTIFGEGP